MSTTSNIGELERRLRDLINAPRRHRELYAGEHAFGQLCSSLDVIGDTAIAIHEYLASVTSEGASGASYLRSYGILQALFPQQDAIRHLAESLGTNYSLPDNVRLIREPRNDAIGHPTRRGPAPDKAFVHISRMSLEASGFTMLTHRPGADSESTSVNLPSLIETQRPAVAAALQDIIEFETDGESSHRLAFRDQPLSSSLPSLLSYYLEKVGESLSGAKSELGISTLSLIEESVANFKKLLAERGELPIHTGEVDHRFGPVANSIQRLREFINGSAGLSRLDAEAFLFRLTYAIRELQEVAARTDAMYAIDPTPPR